MAERKVIVGFAAVGMVKPAVMHRVDAFGQTPCGAHRGSRMGIVRMRDATPEEEETLQLCLKCWPP